MAAAPTPHAGVRIRPRPAPVRGGLLAIFVTSLVFFGALGILGLANGSWPLAIIGEVLSLAVILLGAVLAATTYIQITAEHIIERGFWGLMSKHRLFDVDSVVLVRVYDGDTESELQQLIVRDPAGRRLLRMRGTFWTPDDVQAVVDAIGEPVHEPPEPMTLNEFFERYPGAAYWFERGRLMLALSIAGGLLALTGLVLGVMAVLGLPLAFGA